MSPRCALSQSHYADGGRSRIKLGNFFNNNNAPRERVFVQLIFNFYSNKRIERKNYISFIVNKFSSLSGAE